MDFNDIGLHVPSVMTPAGHVDFKQWAVVACDQYTAQPEYWSKVYAQIGQAPSTVHCILPEIFLGRDGQEHQIRKIQETMRKYIAQKVLLPQPPGFILISRRTTQPHPRTGLLAALDLELYDFSPAAASLIRPTEDTILPRVYPRVNIRRKAPLEFPHIIMLIDDPMLTVIEPLAAKNFPKLYDFDLMMDGGHITGRHIADQRDIRDIADGLRRLVGIDPHNPKQTTGQSRKILYATGDGNHSLTAAKLLWEEVKSGCQRTLTPIADHPGRYVLVEIVNIHNPGLVMRPVHRVVFNVNPDAFLGGFREYLEKQGCTLTMKSGTPAFQNEEADEESDPQTPMRIGYRAGENRGTISIQGSTAAFPVEALQPFLDSCANAKPPVIVDYIHGAPTLDSLAARPNTLGFYLPPLRKEALFARIQTAGTLPKKAFSLGEANEKRYYLESRAIL